MKKFLVVLLACAMIFGFATTAFAADTQISEFSDIADQTQAAKTAIMKLAILGVVEGNEGIGGAYRPTDNLTRAEFSKIVNYLTANVKNAESLANVGSRFTDVSVGNWYTGWVNGAAAKSYMVGDPGGTFRPNANITMNEVVTVALRAVGYNDNVSQRRSTTNRLSWPTNYVSKATDVGVLDDVNFVGSQPATRADMAIIVNAVLDLNMVEYIESDMAFSLALSQGSVDPDGFSEIYYISNETERYTEYERILHKAFGCVNVRSVFEFGYDDEFDEVSAWDYDNLKDGELLMHFYTGYKTNLDVASSYYVNKGYTLPTLAGVQADVIVDVEGDTANENEVLFVNVKGSTVYANAVYMDGNNRIVADGKTYTGSDKYVETIYDSDDKVTGTRRIIDLIDEAFPDCGRINIRGTGSTVADKDNTMPAKLYLDKDGYVYAVKSYNVFRTTGFGVFDEMDGNIAGFVEISLGKDDWPGKFDTSADHVVIKDNAFAKADDIDWLDVVYYMGESYGVKSWLVLPSAEGEMTAQNRTDAKLTIDSKSMGQVDKSRFMYSSDGAETFENPFNLSDITIEKEDFGEAIYAMSYCWPRLAYAAANTNFAKVIGVVTTIEPTQNWSENERKERMEQVTIYNSEGKEVTYKFTNDFRDGYTGYVVDNDLYGDGTSAVTADAFVTPSTTWEDKWTAGITNMADDSLEQFTGANKLEEGDIVQLVLDKNDKVKRIDNYVAYDTDIDNKTDVKVNASRERLTIEGGDFSYLTGTWTLPTGAIVFAVSPDKDGEYDETNIVSVASVLSADFKAAKAAAFDVKKTGDINVLYYIGDISVTKYGVITQKGTVSGGYYYTINGTQVDAANYYLGHDEPVVVSYTMSSGEAKVESYLAWYTGKYANGKYKPATVDTAAIAAINDDKYTVVRGKVSNITTASGRNAIRFEDGSFIYATTDTFLYNLMEDDDATIADLRNEYCLAVYGDYNEAVFVVILGEGYFTTEVVDVPAAAKTVIKGEVDGAVEDGMTGSILTIAEAKAIAAASKAGLIANIQDLLDVDFEDLYTVKDITATYNASTDTLTVSVNVADAQGKEFTLYVLTYDVEPEPEELVSITAPAAQNVANGTALATVKATLGNTVAIVTDGSTTSADVTWAADTTTPYVATTAGTYVLEGTVTLPVDLENTAGVSLTVLVDIVVAAEELVSITAPAAQNVANGTALVDTVTALGTTVTIVTDGGSTTSATVAWAADTTPTYDAATAGTYVLEGTVTLPVGLENTAAVPLTVSVDIIVGS